MCSGNCLGEVGISWHQDGQPVGHSAHCISKRLVGITTKLRNALKAAQNAIRYEKINNVILYDMSWSLHML